jgi:hypothetical protein
MASYLRPRRGKKSTAESQITSATPLKRGEIFFEVPDTGVGTGTGRIKMGDGVTPYSELPYFDTKVNPDTMTVGFTNSTTADSDPYTTNTTLATNVAPTSTLATIFTNIKKLVLNHNSQLNTLNNVLTVTDNEGNSGNIRFAVDENGNYGYKKVGADTVTPFKSGGSGLDGNLIISDTDISEGDTLASGTTYIFTTPNVDIVYNVELLDINTIDFTKTSFNASETYTIIMNDAVSNLKQGDIITINNDLCNEFVVIGKNHDGTTGTIDIMSTTQVGTTQFSVSYGSYNPSSKLGLYAITHSYNEFTNMIISAACKTIEIKVANGVAGGCVYNEKAKIISCVELNLSTFDSNMPGYNSSYGAYKDGEPYTYFTRGAYNASVGKRWVPKGSYGNSSYYWTRTKRANSSYNGIWAVSSSGAISYESNNYDSSYYGVVPIVRLGSMINE